MNIIANLTTTTLGSTTTTNSLNIINKLKNLLVRQIIQFKNIHIIINRFCCVHFQYFSLWKRLDRFVDYNDGLPIFIETDNQKHVIHILKSILNDQCWFLQKDNCDENDIDIIVRIIIGYANHLPTDYEQICEDFLSSKAFVDRLSCQQKESLINLFIPDFLYGSHQKYSQIFILTITQFISYLTVPEQTDFINRAFYSSVLVCKDDNRFNVTWFINIFLCLEDFYRYVGVREMYLFIITFAVCFQNFNKNLNKLMASYAFEQFLIKLGLGYFDNEDEVVKRNCIEERGEVNGNCVYDDRLLILQNCKIRFVKDLFNMVSQNVQNGAEYDVSYYDASYYDVSHIDALDNCNFIPVRISVETFDKIMDSFATVQYNC